MTTKGYFLEVTDTTNHTTVYLFNSTSRKGTLNHESDCYEAIMNKVGYIPQNHDGTKAYNENSVHLDNAKNRTAQCVEENENTSIIDCR